MRAALWPCALLGLLLATQTARADAAPQVQTASGPVVGQTVDGIARFLGIPYAAPPVGERRLRPPAPPVAWTAPRIADHYGSACPQLPRIGPGSTDEDCLFLNVWAPVGAKDLPVMVFIHGGSFNAGDGGDTTRNPNGPGPRYGGTDLARQGHAVVVTLNYRLGTLGFLAAPALDAENRAHTSGNYGLLDQVAALHWVQDNIARFGGDPRRVTVFGESAGGISVLYLLAMPRAGGLFQRAIVESANDGTAPPLATAEAHDKPVVAAIGCDKDDDAATADCLRAAPVSAFLAHGGPLPTIDGHVIPNAPRAAFNAGFFNHVPVLIGTNADEGTYFATVAEKSVGRALNQDDRQAIEARAFGAHAADVDAAYPPSAYPSPGAALAAIVTDSFFACPSAAVREALAPIVPVQGYEFRQPDPARNFPLPVAPVSPPDIPLGDAHTTELAYVFGHDGEGKPLAGHDAALSARMIAQWTGATAGAPFETFAEPAAAPRDFGEAHHCLFWASIGGPEALFVSVPRH
ncbi:carboxylesterase/lipase family protein [Acidisphaera rubrifaciens]|uniref:Carboxylic ester hydrolase n=1 Tax=Acidisphaera rubrifaciens HS-AP3 TaxID=1231350 RepID=A0A0D6P328_9PROT|nr:carboxylesterase family protein [Acidisphaera rubrifaciens]GAN76087.1 carboxylesterase type B [Acidisphaera rubrifaciens HS-AP3]